MERAGVLRAEEPSGQQVSRNPPAALPASVRKRRCAIYTRKSTDEGLDKEFNTLDAQRDACEAYITSQRAEIGRAHV